jgi:hypothetical protein
VTPDPGAAPEERPCYDLHGDNRTRTPHYDVPDHSPASIAQPASTDAQAEVEAAYIACYQEVEAVARKVDPDLEGYSVGELANTMRLMLVDRIEQAESERDEARRDRAEAEQSNYWTQFVESQTRARGLELERDEARAALTTMREAWRGADEDRQQAKAELADIGRAVTVGQVGQFGAAAAQDMYRQPGSLPADVQALVDRAAAAGVALERMRALPEKWVGDCDERLSKLRYAGAEWNDGITSTYNACAEDVEAALSAPADASGEG